MSSTENAAGRPEGDGDAGRPADGGDGGGNNGNNNNRENNSALSGSSDGSGTAALQKKKSVLRLRERAIKESQAALSRKVETEVKLALQTLSLEPDHFDEVFAVYDAITGEYSTTICKAVSKKQRNDENLKRGTLVYGEIHFKTYALTFEKIKRLYGGLQSPGGVYYDIGSGSGKPVFASILMHEFSSAVGIEILSGLHKVSLEMLEIWQEKKTEMSVSEKTKETIVDFVCGDITTYDWSDGDVCFANSTCFSNELMQQLAVTAAKMKPGSFFITFTRRLPSPHFEVLEYERHLMSLGEATVFIHRRKSEEGGEAKE